MFNVRGRIRIIAQPWTHRCRNVTLVLYHDRFANIRRIRGRNAIPCYGPYAVATTTAVAVSSIAITFFFPIKIAFCVFYKRHVIFAHKSVRAPHTRLLHSLETENPTSRVPGSLKDYTRTKLKRVSINYCK